MERAGLFSTRNPENIGSRVHILNFSDTEAAVAFTHGDRNWLVREQSFYEPMRDEQAMDHPMRQDGVYPFVTTGERWVTDLTTGKTICQEFESEEGQIQGLVYALEALLAGGTLSREDYEAYICEELIPEDFDKVEGRHDVQ